MQHTKVFAVVTFPVWGTIVAIFYAIGVFFKGLGWVLSHISKATWPILEPVWRLMLKPVLKTMGIILGCVVKYFFIGVWKTCAFLWLNLLRPFLNLVALPLKGLWWILSTIAPAFRYLRARKVKWNGRHRNSTSIRRFNLEGAEPSPEVDGNLGRDPAGLEPAQLSSQPDGKKHMFSFKLTRGEPWIEAMMLRTCESGSKSSCWACGIQICQGCARKVACDAPRTAQHFELCAPQCSKCYFESECRNPRSFPTKNCVFHGGGYAPEKASKPVVLMNVQDVCPPCAGLTREGLREAREAQEVEELRHLSRSNLKCKSCGRRIAGSGPRWWACKCGMECKSEYHPAWGLET